MNKNNKYENSLKSNSLNKFPIDIQKQFNKIIPNLKKLQNKDIDIDVKKETSVQFYNLLLDMFTYSGSNYILVSDISYLCSDYISELYLYVPMDTKRDMIELSDIFIHELDIPLNLSHIAAPELVQKTVKNINRILQEIKKENL